MGRPVQNVGPILSVPLLGGLHYQYFRTGQAVSTAGAVHPADSCPLRWAFSPLVLSRRLLPDGILEQIWGTRMAATVNEELLDERLAELEKAKSCSSRNG